MKRAPRLPFPAAIGSFGGKCMDTSIIYIDNRFPRNRIILTSAACDYSTSRDAFVMQPGGATRGAGQTGFGAVCHLRAAGSITDAWQTELSTSL